MASSIRTLTSKVSHGDDAFKIPTGFLSSPIHKSKFKPVTFTPCVSPKTLVFNEEESNEQQQCPIGFHLKINGKIFIKVQQAIRGLHSEYENIHCKFVKRTTMTTYRVELMSSPGCNFCLHKNGSHQYAFVYFIIDQHNITQYCYSKQTCAANTHGITRSNDDRELKSLLFPRQYINSQPKETRVTIEINEQNRYDVHIDEINSILDGSKRKNTSSNDDTLLKKRKVQ